jgi:hypothetical protein
MPRVGAGLLTATQLSALWPFFEKNLAVSFGPLMLLDALEDVMTPCEKQASIIVITLSADLVNF